MKLILSISFFLFCLSAIAQKNRKNTYNTKIDTAGKVEINGGITNIQKADTVFIGQVIVNQTLKTNIFFLGSYATKDTSGIYTTKYKFGPINNPGSYTVYVKIKFDKPIIIYKPASFFETPCGGVSQESGNYSDDFTEISIRAQTMCDYCFITVRSKQPLFATIYGIDGRLN